MQLAIASGAAIALSLIALAILAERLHAAATRRSARASRAAAPPQRPSAVPPQANLYHPGPQAPMHPPAAPPVQWSPAMGAPAGVQAPRPRPGSLQVPVSFQPSALDLDPPQVDPQGTPLPGTALAGDPGRSAPLALPTPIKRRTPEAYAATAFGDSAMPVLSVREVTQVSAQEPRFATEDMRTDVRLENLDVSSIPTAGTRDKPVPHRVHPRLIPRSALRPTG